MSLQAISIDDLEKASGGANGDPVREGSIKAGQAFGGAAAAVTGNPQAVGWGSWLGGKVMGAANSVGNWAGEKVGDALYPKSLPAPKR